MCKQEQSVVENQQYEPKDSHFSDHFWHSKTIKEIALAQGVQAIKNFDVLLGGWPEDKLNDNFEETLEHWRHDKRSG